MNDIAEIKVLDHGYVALVDTMGDDRTPAQTARTSFRNRKERTVEEDAKLTDYLIRNAHTTPLEFVQLRYYLKMPMFVGEQILRHRTASINKISYRYVTAVREFYIPDAARMQRKAENNKQGSSSEMVSDPGRCSDLMLQAGNRAFWAYEQLLEEGLAPELARAVLPASVYTEMYWQIDMNNFLKFIGLRTDPHAQWETQEYAHAMLELARAKYPTIIGSWEKHRRAA